METKEKLVSQVIGSEKAKTVVLFGGSPVRRDEIIRLISEGVDLTVYGTLNEEEGMEKLKELDNKVDIVLIGGRYTPSQRKRISRWVTENLPKAKLSRPGFDYPYSNDEIRKDIVGKL
ncbi:hypothetical protein [Jejuia pallidilutea]|nr:hypothetical protein [Jejuia pallidilutea]GAL66140.1 hypothetical protein JCM19301_705 [Jejuia pallidilutea]GAL88172.1 hypothetical protein JCM19538_2535 [Jejuia pallidilutea]